MGTERQMSPLQISGDVEVGRLGHVAITEIPRPVCVFERLLHGCFKLTLDQRYDVLFGGLASPYLHVDMDVESQVEISVSGHRSNLAWDLKCKGG